jgi:hypothetical protein
MARRLRRTWCKEPNDIILLAVGMIPIPIVARLSFRNAKATLACKLHANRFEEFQ